MDLNLDHIYGLYKAIQGIHDYFKELKWIKRNSRFDVNSHYQRMRVGDTGFTRYGFAKPMGVSFGSSSARTVLGPTNFSRSF